MKLKEYSDFTEKGKIFDIHTIDNKDELDGLILSVKSMKAKPFYRGVSEAKYKIYTSAQREWITKELSNTKLKFDDFIEILISEVKSQRNNLMKRYFKSLDYNVNDLLALSFLQHYGAPSPLLDITSNIYKSLFFCFYKMSFIPSENIIDNYTSLYVFDDIRTICSLLPSTRNVKDMTYKKLKDTPTLGSGRINLDDISKSNGDNLYETLLRYEKLREQRLILIDDLLRYSLRALSKEKSFYLPSITAPNLNVLAQDGAFIVYINDVKPLEDFYHDEKAVKLQCYNIHKSLKEYVFEKYLKTRSINEDTLFPQEESIAKDSYIGFLRRLNK